MSEPALLLMHCCSSSSVSLYSTCHLTLLKSQSQRLFPFFSIASIRKGCDAHAFSRNMKRPRPVPDKQTWSLSSTQTIYQSVMLDQHNGACVLLLFRCIQEACWHQQYSHHSLFSYQIFILFVCLGRFSFYYSFPIRRGLSVGLKTNNKPQIVS